MNASKRAEIFARFKLANPEPRTELHYENPFQLLVAVILSAQATDKGVNRATAALFSQVRKPAQMLKLGLPGLIKHVRTIGLYNAKAANIMATCQILVDKHNGEVPRERADLEALPGVGRKTANVVLNTAFGEPTMAVDTHIYRVANRTRIATGKTVRNVEDRLLRLIPKEYLLDAHHWLILHGRYTCKARKPECANCLIADLCEFPQRQRPEA